MTRAFHNPRLPRLLHPAAWWAWAIGLAMAANRTTNPLLLACRSGDTESLLLVNPDDSDSF